MRAVALAAVAALLVAQASAISISWTGFANDNQWTTHNNWYPNQVPGPNDDVTISKGTVLCTIPTGVNSLGMGDSFDAPANLTIFKSFFIGDGGMTVQGNGNLFINTGLDQVQGTVNIAGNLFFVDGVLGGQWTIGSRGVADLSNTNEKAFSAASFVSQGTLKLGGVLALNQSSVITLQSATTANGNLMIQNQDGSAALFDASAAQFTFANGDLTVQAHVKLGQFTLQSGNLTLFDDITFTESLNIPSGSYVSALGAAKVNMTAGATGAGVITSEAKQVTFGNLNVSGAVNLMAGVAIIAASSSVGVLTYGGANIAVNAAVSAGQLNLLRGVISGTGVTSGEHVYVKASGFTLGAKVTVTSQASIEKSQITFGMEGGLTIASGATAGVQGTLQLTGPAYIPGVTNNGVIDATAAVASQNIDIRGGGSVVVSTTMSVNTATISQAKITLKSGATFSGQNTFLTIGKVVSGTDGTVKAVIGDYHLSCQGECDNVSTPGTTTPTTKFSFSA